MFTKLLYTKVHEFLWPISFHASPELHLPFHKAPHHYKLNTILLLYYLKSSVIPHSLNMTILTFRQLPESTTSHIADLLPLQTVSLTFSETLTPFLLLLSSH